MSGMKDLNIVLGQGNAVKEIQNLRRQSLDPNQQFVAQRAQDTERKERSRVSVTENKREIKADQKHKNEEGGKDRGKGSRGKRKKEEHHSSEDNLLDIRV